MSRQPICTHASKVTVILELDHFQAQPWLVEEARHNPRIEFPVADGTGAALSVIEYVHAHSQGAQRAA